MTTQDKRRLCGLMLFAYGGVANFLLLVVCTRGWLATSNGSAAWKYGSAGFVTLAGGAFFYFLMRRWIGRALELRPPRVPLYLLKGGLFGVLATLATLEGLYILTAAILAFKAHGAYPRGGEPCGVAARCINGHSRVRNRPNDPDHPVRLLLWRSRGPASGPGGQALSPCWGVEVWRRGAARTRARTVA